MSGDHRNETPEDFWSCVLSSRLQRDDYEARRQRRLIMDVIRTARMDERKRILALVTARRDELADAAESARGHAPNMVGYCLSRRSEAQHLARSIRKIKP